MCEVAQGDIICTEATRASPHLGRARSYCYESPKPTEFVTAVRSVRMGSLRVSANARTPLRRSAVVSAAKVVWIATTAGIVCRNGQGKARRPLHLQIGDMQVANKCT
jgi:hypothetical protein